MSISVQGGTLMRLREGSKVVFGILFIIIGGGRPMEASKGIGIFAMQEATLLLINGHIYTMTGHAPDSPGPVVEAVAIGQDRIMDVGTTHDMMKYRARTTQIIDLKGAMVVPGLTDSHLHLAGVGRQRRILDLVGTRSIREIQERLKDYATRKRETSWLFGRGWDQNDWDNPVMPQAEDLDVIVSDRPVILSRIDGHALWVNHKALNLAGITTDTPDPEGGKILRDNQRRPTGILIDNAMDLINRALPVPTQEERKQDLLEGIKGALQVGLTEVHDAGIGPIEWEAYMSLGKSRNLAIRVYAMAEEKTKLSEMLLQNGPIDGLFDHHLTLRAIKAFADGALGSRGAALMEPYTDEPSNYGLLRFEPKAFKKFCKKVLQAGLQLNTHAIGDRANRMVLDAYEEAFHEVGCKDCRFRIEHAQVLSPQDIPRFRILGVIPSMQPTHATSDMYWAPRRLGDRRLTGAYAWKALVQEGNPLPGGSDAPVESLDPRLGLYAAVTRQDLKGWPEGGWLPHQRLTFVQALWMFTRWAAYAAYEENLRGSIRPGMLADFTIFSEDLFHLAPKEWLTVPVLYTIVGGKVVYSAISSPSEGSNSTGK